MAETTDRELLITIIKDLATLKAEMNGYKQLERDVRELQKKIYLFMGFAGAIGGSIVAIAESLASNV
jgi:hypothetical protein